MPQNFRQTEILDIARYEKKVVVEELAERLGVTVQTIRRDLSDLTDEGKLERVHGGAILPSTVSNIGYEDRQSLNEGAKVDIAKRCAREIPDNSSLFMNIGTSTEAVARELLKHNNLTVITNNMNVANILVANESCDIKVAGGTLRRSDGGLIGDLTIQVIEQFKVDFAVIGTSSMDHDGDLLDFDLQEVRVSKAIIKQARKTYLVTDASKLKRNAPVRIASLSEIDAIFTDKLPSDLRMKCEAWDTKVYETSK
ncbi:DeoR family transcriptional regulator [Rhodobacterales bacterium 52_120_T64]|nr:DeoR family transcriptional regulator [Rhodobacterales bacterium 52_120_T64]